MAYGEVLKMELNASLNKLNDPEFDLGVQKVLMQPTRPKANPGFQKKISDDHAESFLQENPLLNRIDLGIVENSLLPTRHFFEKYTDSLRIFINETSSPSQRVRDAVEIEIKDVLRSMGINMLDKTFNVPMARDYIYRGVKRERQEEEFLTRTLQMITDKKLRNRYFEMVDKELQKFDGDKESFYQLVNRNVSEIFEQAYLKRLQKIVDKSTEAQNLEKRRMFLRLKKFMIKNRILQFHQAEV